MSSTPTDTFTCGICGENHDGLPTDCGYKLPDDIWAIPEDERARRARYTADLCQMGDRWFIRCLLKIPFIDQPGYYGWGIWVEVAKSVFDLYLELYEVDAMSEPLHPGTIANRLDGYDRTIGEPVLIQFGTAKDRPTVQFPAESRCVLSTEQAQGINAARYHEILQRKSAE